MWKEKKFKTIEKIPNVGNVPVESDVISSQIGIVKQRGKNVLAIT